MLTDFIMGLTPFRCFLMSLSIPVLTITIIVLDRKRRSPEKSYWNHIINLAVGPIRFLGIGPFARELTLANAFKHATKKTGLTDFGDTSFTEVYSAVTDSELQINQKYTNLGFISARIELNQTFVRRLKFIQYLKDVPRVLNVAVPEPTFVMGLPRTGTTLLHRLLSLDPYVRAPLLWELLSPVPHSTVTGEATEGGSSDPVAAAQAAFDADRDKRAKFIERLMNTRKEMGDRSLAHIHEVEWDLPEECFLTLSDEIPSLSQYFYSTYMRSDEVEPMIRQQMAHAYKHHRKYLQLLSYQCGEGLDAGKMPNSNNNSKFGTKPVRRWMLKCPIHMYYPEEIAQAFPDAKLVWTHRHPVNAVPSFCSLLKSCHQLYYENECRDEKKLGEIIFKVSERMLCDAPKRIKNSGLECSNVLYVDLIKDPKSVVQEIYRKFNWNYTSEFDASMDAYLEIDRKHRAELKIKKAKEGGDMHSYSPEEYGMTRDGLSSGAYADYVEKFKIPL
jgi:hypothetical protein